MCTRDMKQDLEKPTQIESRALSLARDKCRKCPVAVGYHSVVFSMALCAPNLPLSLNGLMHNGHLVATSKADFHLIRVFGRKGLLALQPLGFSRRCRDVSAISRPSCSAHMQ